MFLFSQIKDIKHVYRNFHSVAWIMPQWSDLGVLGVKNLSVRICDGAPSAAHSSIVNYYDIAVIFAAYTEELRINNNLSKRISLKFFNF